MHFNIEVTFQENTFQLISLILNKTCIAFAISSGRPNLNVLAFDKRQSVKAEMIRNARHTF